MIITVNGEYRDVRTVRSLGGLLAALELDPETVILEHNGEIVPHERVHDRPLNENDTVEVIRFVGGG
jgi:thiamine biosynthesis protein ThiS